MATSKARQILVISVSFGVAAAVLLWNFGFIGAGRGHRHDAAGAAGDRTNESEGDARYRAASAGSLPIDVF